MHNVAMTTKRDRDVKDSKLLNSGVAVAAAAPLVGGSGGGVPPVSTTTARPSLLKTLLYVYEVSYA